MTLHPAAEALLAASADAPGPDFATVTAAEFRASFTPPTGVGPAIARIEDLTIEGACGDIPIRLYYPRAAEPPAADPLPITLFLHGGGFTIGDIAMADAVCRALSLAGDTLVVSVDYRLSPETPFPGGLLDAAAALDWAHDNAARIGGRADRIAVAGDSTGGTFAAALAQRSRTVGPRICHQLLFYPPLDHRCDTPTYRDYARGYLLTSDMMKWYWQQYLRDETHGHDTYASPGRERDLRGVPSATIHIAEHDILRSEIEQYAADLGAAGVEVAIVQWPGQIHGFLLQQGANPDADAAVLSAGRALAAAFAAITVTQAAL